MKTIFYRMFLLCTFLTIASFLSVGCSDNNSNTDGGAKESATPDKPKPQCEFASDCKSCSESCSADGKCEEIKCSASDDCRCNWKCVSGTCYDPKEAPCESNDDCKDKPKEWKCDNGKCIDGGCRTNDDCKDEPGKPVCNTEKNECMKRPCGGNDDCKDPNKPVCKSGDCVEDTGGDLGAACGDTTPCKLSFNCFEDEGKKLCRKPCNPSGSSSQCKKDEVCIAEKSSKQGGLCLAPGAGLKQGEDCSDNKACQRHLVCAFAEDGEKCRRQCTNDDACELNKETCQAYQKARICLPKPSPCGPGRSCAGEESGYEVCNGGVCQLVLCPTQRTCPGSDKCQKNGRCVPRNCPTEKCDPLYECKNNKCVRTNEGLRCGEGQAIKFDGCGNGLACEQVGYLQACVRKCDDGKCPTGLTCVDNQSGKKVCMQSCPNAGDKCKYQGYFCMNLKRKPQGKYCVPAGQPTGGDILETCSAQKPCLPDLQCYRGFSGASGYCTLNCTSQTDCGGVANATCTDYFDGRKCYYKCANFGSCTVNGTVRGTCTRRSGNNFICRPR